MTGFLKRKGKFGHRDTCTEVKVMARQGQRLERCIYKPKIAGNHQKLEEARKDPPLESSETAWSC